VSGIEAELSPREMDWLRALVLGPEAAERRLVALARGGRVVHAVRSDPGSRGGPVAAASLARIGPASGAAALRALPEAQGAERVVLIRADAARANGASLLADALDGAASADPPWLAALATLRRVAGRLGVGLGSLLPDGAYGAIARERPAAAPLCVFARVKGGRVERLVGGDALGFADVKLDDAARADRAARRVGRMQLLVTGSTAALRALVTSPRPAAALEHARIRGQLDVPAVSGRVSATLLALRLATPLSR
jgi:hypothetical protein